MHPFLWFIRKGRQDKMRQKMETYYKKQKAENDAKQLEKNRQLVLKTIVRIRQISRLNR